MGKQINHIIFSETIRSAKKRREHVKSKNQSSTAKQIHSFKRTNILKRYIPLYTMMIPGIVYLVINNYIPMGGLIIAFKKYNYSLGILDSPWAGFSNFEFLFRTNDAAKIIRNTLGYNIVFIILGNIMAVTVAVMLNEVRSRQAKKIYQTLILIPYLISMVIVSYIGFAFLSQDSGFINNSILEPLGLDKIQWYTSPQYWPIILTIVYLWKSFGYNSIIYFATVIGIDASLYEAAMVDGANKWKQIWHITLPGLKTTIITMVLLNMGRIFYSDFGLFYQVPMNSGPLIDITNTIDTYVYRGLTQLNDIGRASAAGFIQSLVGFVVVFIANFIVSKIDKESSLF